MQIILAVETSSIICKQISLYHYKFGKNTVQRNDAIFLRVLDINQF